MYTIKSVLMNRDEMTAQEADELINEAREDFNQRITNGEMPWDFMQEWFDLEPDYLDEFLV